ncbi:alpha-hydroxy acid oxidase [Novosphingobium resinovorum]|uniref:Alpha-hydroxy-acid oxidizing enzyme n=1 Tax=Novosphingobium resinovorum TaxID=158500 RepID=A0A1D8A0Q5_9SPHN|nr:MULTISPECIES: alpha-hydroxy acid oxidase [Novosphingobium]AOR75652.1 alpha-hydroxy-acid oxidizing enzyme [Novosphingobium resinovorum]MBF7010986.1 alpha-hydroxy-acid oxidizing protein [Novosphingobium sp. HR1a]WJM28980.1 alpha-hydroxy acid oxidase [Novosphingobium resinovorum]
MGGIAKKAHNIAQVRALAKRRLPRAIWEFIERGTEDDLLIQRNVAALQAVQFLPRTLRDVAERSAGIELFGRRQPLPLVIAPTGVSDLLWHRGERAIARAAASAGIPFTQTTSSTTSFAEIAKCATAGHWMQMYLWERRDLSWQVVDTARENGAEVLVLTVDTPMWPLREFNKRAGMSNPIRPNATLVSDFLKRPSWFASVICRYYLEGGLPQFANYPREVGGKLTGTVSRVANSASVCWRDVAELRRRWPGKLVVKGVLSAEDARIALDHGVDGIAVSNHGGRNFDSSPPAIDVLAGIVDAVGDSTTILFDSGVRRGADVIKALAIGAKAVLVGRATLYGCAAGGEHGARHAIDLLANEIDVAMAMVGVTRLEKLDRSYLMPGTFRG